MIKLNLSLEINLELHENFKAEIISLIKDIPKMPYANRKSIYFDSDDIRDMVIKGYLVVYKIDNENQTIDVFGFTKYQDDPFGK